MSNYNVLLIMADQLRWDAIGCYGNSVIETSNLDGLASEGTVFENAYTPVPSCNPARATLLSGMNPWHTGVLNSQPMGTGFPQTLPGEMAAAGYHTQGIGVMSFSPGRPLNGFHHTVLDSGNDDISDYKQWFDRNKTGDYDDLDHGIGANSWMARPYHAPEFLHRTNWTVKESIHFLQRKDPTKPFFLKTSFARPHSPYDPPAYYFDLYLNQKQVPAPKVGDWAHIHDVAEDAAKPEAWRGVHSEEEIRRARAGYYGSIHHIDHQIGRLLTKLKKDGLFDDTLIIFTADHGDMLGDHHLWRKTYGYEGSAHIPLIIKPPQYWGSVESRVKQPVLLYDIMPTVLDAANIEIPEKVDGMSLLPLMKGESNDWREYVHGEHGTCYSEEQEMQYLTDGRMKYIWFPRLGTEQLFDLTKDRYECDNLAGKDVYQDELYKWRQRLISELKPREAGLTDGDRLVCQAGKPYLVSPNYEKRMKR